MTRERWHDLLPPLIFAAGIVGSTFLAVGAPGSFWRPHGASALLGLSLALACLAAPRRWGRRTARVVTAAVVGAAFVIAGTLVAIRDPKLVATLLPALGAVAWVVVFPSGAKSSGSCAGS